MSAQERLLELELEREARRKRRNRWLVAMVVVLVLFGAFALWGVTSMNAANDRSEHVRDLQRLNSTGVSVVLPEGAMA